MKRKVISPNLAFNKLANNLAIFTDSEFSLQRCYRNLSFSVFLKNGPSGLTGEAIYTSETSSGIFAYLQCSVVHIDFAHWRHLLVKCEKNQNNDQ